MKSRIIVTGLCIQLIGCASWRYPNWEYVRVEDKVPSTACVYKIQEACSQPANKCLNWHKQRATQFNADTVVISKESSQNSYASSFWTGQIKGGDNTSTLAEYYYCNGAKNIKPPQ